MGHYFLFSFSVIEEENRSWNKFQQKHQSLNKRNVKKKTNKKPNNKQKQANKQQQQQQKYKTTPLISHFGKFCLWLTPSKLTHSVPGQGRLRHLLGQGAPWKYLITSTAFAAVKYIHSFIADLFVYITNKYINRQISICFC